MYNISNCKIEGKEEHILNRKPRVNGEVVEAGKKLSLVKELTAGEIKSRIKALLKVYQEIKKKEESKKHKFSITNKGNSYQIKFGDKTGTVEIEKFSPQINARIKSIING